MKVSVSVPDGLWDRARSQRPDLNNSHLVQEALETFTKPADTAGFSLAMPDDVAGAFQAARDQLASLARTQFEEGYRAAVELTPKLGWWYVQRLVEAHYDVKAWCSSVASSNVEEKLGHIPKGWGTDDEVIAGLLKALGNLVEPWGDDSFGPSIPYLRGFAQAFRELWEQVNVGESAGVEATAIGEGALGQ
jgi:hypothetical protein